MVDVFDYSWILQMLLVGRTINFRYGLQNIYNLILKINGHQLHSQ